MHNQFQSLQQEFIQLTKEFVDKIFAAHRIGLVAAM